MGNSKFKLKLTIEERILLHIRSYTKFEHNLQAPFELTQDGIANAVSVVRSAIPRSMKKLVDKDMVKEQIGHVEGVVRRRKIYFLTTDGLVRAQEITEKLEQVECQVKDQDGNVEKMKFSEINKHLDTNFSMLELLEGLLEDGIFDYPLFIAKKAEGADRIEEKEGYLAFTSKAPKLLHFIGREGELQELQNWLDGPDYRVIVVHGIAGMGKTTLALKIMEEYRSKKHLVWYRFHQWDTLRYFVKTLAQFMAQLGRRELQRNIDTETIVDLNTIGEIIEAGMKDLEVLIVVDDFHKAREEIIPIFSLFVEILERQENVKLLIFSRNIVPFYDRRHVRVKKLVGEKLLEGLTREAARELLEARGLRDINMDIIYKITAGHPLALELLKKDSDQASIPDIVDLNLYIQEEIFSKVPEFEQSLLAYASVYRYGAPKEILLEQAEGGFETLKDLSARSLLEHSDGIYNVHDLIREFFYETQPASVRKTHHSRASQYYLEAIRRIEEELQSADETVQYADSMESKTQYSTESDQAGPLSMLPKTTPVKSYPAKGEDQLSLAVIEGLYHSVYCERFQKAGELVASYGEYLQDSDLSEELKELMEQIPIEMLEDETRAMVLYHLGEIYNHLSDFEMAYYYFSDSLERFRLIHGESKDPKRMARIYRRLGFIYERKNDLEKAKSYHEKSLELATKAVDAFAIADAYGALGWLYWNQGEHERANEYYDKCINMADKIEDMPGKAKVYLGICMALAKRGELEEAIEYYEKCLDILERNEDIFKLARSYEGMGDHYLRSIFSQFLKSTERKS